MSFTMSTWRPSRPSPPQIHNHSRHPPRIPPSLSPSLANVHRCSLIDVYHRHFRKVPFIYHLPESAVPEHQLCPRLRKAGGHRRCLFSPHHQHRQAASRCYLMVQSCMDLYPRCFQVASVRPVPSCFLGRCIGGVRLIQLIRSLLALH